MVSTSACKLITDEAQDTLINLLFPIGTVITPNIPEAQILCGFKIKDEKDMVKAGKYISRKIKGPVLVKGGHLVSDAIDLLCTDDDMIYWYRTERVDNLNTHGTGCTRRLLLHAILRAERALMKV